MSHSSRCSGFTLLELLAVLGVLILALALTPPLFHGTYDRLRVEAATRELVSAVRQARNLSVNRQAQFVLDIDVEAKTYTLNGKLRTLSLPGETGLSLVTADSEIASPSAGSIRFFPDGSSTGGRITLDNGALHYRIDVNWITGRASLLR